MAENRAISLFLNPLAKEKENLFSFQGTLENGKKNCPFLISSGLPSENPEKRQGGGNTKAIELNHLCPAVAPYIIWP